MTEIKCENIDFYYTNSKNKIINDCCVKLKSGQVIGLVGLNGSGKTTLLKLLSGIIAPKRGTIFIDNKEIKGTKQSKKIVTLLPENAKLFLLGPTVLEELLHFYSTEDEITHLLQQYKLEFLLKRKIYELSEGQRRLIAILSAFQQEKEIFYLDEPTIGLDSIGRAILFDVINKIRLKNGIIVIATNDTRILSKMDRIIGIAGGNIVIDGIPEKTLPSLQETIANQVSRLVNDLKKNNIVIPDIVTAESFNNYLNSLEE